MLPAIHQVLQWTPTCSATFINSSLRELTYSALWSSTRSRSSRES
uniref:Uncharacterized protein n=1 Tax=Anguilla anguilla TaxID=7936 RepID=A0A0E9U1Z0_ANGAN